MRKITKEVVGAFNRGESRKIGNTQSLEYQYGVSLFLFGNRIALKNREDNELYVSLCGWDTVTTRERLNGIPGVHVYRQKGQTYLNGKPWSGALVAMVPYDTGAGIILTW